MTVAVGPTGSAAMVPPAEVVEIDDDPYTLDNLRDSHRFYEKLRDAGPVVYLKRFGVYATGRYEEAAEVLRDHARFSSTAGIGLVDLRQPGAWRERSPLSEVDPPQHGPVRAVFTRIMSPAVIRKLGDDFAAEAKGLVDRALDTREIDGVHTLVEPFVIRVVMDAVGLQVPTERFADVVAIGDLNFNAFGPNNERLVESQARVASINDWYHASFRRENLVPGLIGEQLYEAEDEGSFAPGTGEFHVRTFFRAGTDTTISSIGQTILQLALHPALADEVRQDPKLLKSAFEEAIRYDSAVRHMFRMVVDDTVVSGMRLKKDMKIGAFLGSANRDPRYWQAADTFDIRRRTAGIHLGFGHGIHTCIGQMLARMEAESILGELLRRTKSIEVAGDFTYRAVNGLRTLESLPLRITPN